MKKIILYFTLIIIAQSSKGQQVYCDFDGTKVISFGPVSGVLDSLFLNPAPNNVDSSTFCAKYVRDTVLYDFIKIYPNMKLADVTPYANNIFSTPKIKMKLYSSAPIGTMVNLQLGIKSVDNYPAGIHSEYMATTTAQNSWQNLTFNYYQSPAGSLVAPTEIDKVVILFHPNSTARDTIYFDDLLGPELITGTSIPQLDASKAIKLYQNNPNPAKDNTHISFQLGTPGVVSLKLYDMLGNQISELINQYMKSGLHSVPLETEDMPNGIYFYILKKEGVSKTMKMVVSK